MKKVILILSLIFISLNFITAQEFKVNTSDFVRDIMINRKTDSSIKMVWWMPTIYWTVSNQGNSFVTDEMVKELELAVKDYNIIAALDGSIGPFGMKYNDDTTVILVDQKGNKYNTIPNEEISSETLSVLDVLKPVLSRMIGKMGENLNFYVFPLFEDDSSIDPYKDGSFTVLVNDESFKYKLPLGSLFEKKKCTIDDELYNGAWTYCPFHGSELIEQ